MVNQELVEILKQGVEVWNKWLKNNLNVKIDLNHADLRGADLRGANFFDANFSYAKLSGADLRDADLILADLRGADLRGADITGASLCFISRAYWQTDGIKCDYVYFDSKGKERTPKDRDFKPGEFETLYKWRPLNDFERLIERSIEFPPEYKQAGVSILNYFSEIIRQKYPESEATVQIKQDGLKVTMTIDPADGEREVIEKTLNDYGLVITGNMTPEEYAGNNPVMLIELKSQLNIAQVQIENQKLLIGYQDREIKKQDVKIETLLSIVGNAVQSRPVIPVTVSPVINVSPSIRHGNENSINAHDLTNSTLTAGNNNELAEVKNSQDAK